MLEEAINWNKVEDQVDFDVWNLLVSNFWIDTKFAISNDLVTWNTLTPLEKLTTVRVFVGLTRLDTIQGKFGAYTLIPDAVTPHEVAVYSNILFMENIHAKSYSSIFSTYLSTEEINDLFRWAKEDKWLNRKAEIILSYYEGEDPLKRKIASTMLESFLFYSGFFMPLYWSTKAKLPNAADIIRLIIRDEAVHGYYIGYKFQQGFNQETPERQQELKDFTYDLLFELYHNEVEYTQNLYDDLGLTEKVKVFLRYNANKALNNLGFEALFSKEETQVDAGILAALSPNSGENQDFFSGAGNSYSMATVEELKEDEWAF